jgi:hypothetical protein
MQCCTPRATEHSTNLKIGWNATAVMLDRWPCNVNDAGALGIPSAVHQASYRVGRQSCSSASCSSSSSRFIPLPSAARRPPPARSSSSSCWFLASKSKIYIPAHSPSTTVTTSRHAIKQSESHCIALHWYSQVERDRSHRTQPSSAIEAMTTTSFRVRTTQWHEPLHCCRHRRMERSLEHVAVVLLVEENRRFGSILEHTHTPTTPHVCVTDNNVINRHDNHDQCKHSNIQVGLLLVGESHVEAIDQSINTRAAAFYSSCSLSRVRSSNQIDLWIAKSLNLTQTHTRAHTHKFSVVVLLQHYPSSNE